MFNNLHVFIALVIFWFYLNYCIRKKKKVKSWFPRDEDIASKKGNKKQFYSKKSYFKSKNNIITINLN